MAWIRKGLTCFRLVISANRWQIWGLTAAVSSKLKSTPYTWDKILGFCRRW